MTARWSPSGRCIFPSAEQFDALDAVGPSRGTLGLQFFLAPEGSKVRASPFGRAARKSRSSTVSTRRLSSLSAVAMTALSTRPRLRSRYVAMSSRQRSMSVEVIGSRVRAPELQPWRKSISASYSRTAYTDRPCPLPDSSLFRFSWASRGLTQATPRPRRDRIRRSCHFCGAPLLRSVGATSARLPRRIYAKPFGSGPLDSFPRQRLGDGARRRRPRRHKRSS